MVMIIHEPLYPFDSERVFAIKVIAFDKSDRILGVRKGRSFDIINGCQEWDDDSLEDAARREAYEQAGAALEQLTVAAVIEHDPDENKEVEENGPFYTLVITGYIKGFEEEPLFPKQKCRHRFLKKSSLLRHAERPDLHKIVDMAEFYLSANEQNYSEKTQCGGLII
jgi:ADP-ribose pyrophosphatase YjhB (NUDIX family)